MIGEAGAAAPTYPPLQRLHGSISYPTQSRIRCIATPTKEPAPNNLAHQGCYHNLDRPMQQQRIYFLDLRAL